jgi:cell wall assembly regulator SMI1
LYSDGERKSHWLGRAAASEEAIAATEARLGLQLPTDYRMFLRTSNGLAALSSAAPALLPVEAVDYLRNVVDAAILQILKEYPGDDMPAAMDRCIQISDSAAEEVVVLIPPRAVDASWQTWFFAHWVPGEIRYPSFRHYLEQIFQALQAEAA